MNILTVSHVTGDCDYGPCKPIAAGLPQRSASVESNRYSVLLLYPDHANDSGTQTYYAFVTAGDAQQAVATAQAQAADAQDGIECDPGDFTPLLVTQGHHASLPLFNL
jgi:hypothetical protein